MVFLKQNKGFVLGFSIGFGTGFVARDWLPAITKMIKPATKLVIRSGITLIEKFRETMARAGETLEDLTAEVNLELKEEQEKRVTHKNSKKRAITKIKKTVLPKSPPL